MIAAAQIDEILSSYGCAPQIGLSDRVLVYIELLMKWSRKISLTTLADPLEIVRFHFGESLFAISRVEMQRSRLADVGTGAGFPGLPLAMAVPSLEVTLIESNAKKCAFLAEVIRKLEIRNATIYRGRMESFSNENRRFGFVTARALGHFDELLDWSKLHLAARGKLLLWLGAEHATELLSRIDWEWQPPIKIPETSRRVLLIGEAVWS